MAKNYIAKIREDKKDTKHFSVIILAAGVGSRAGGECKSLLRIGKESVLQRQVRLIRKKYGESVNIIIVAGHKQGEVIQNFNDSCQIVTNDKFDHTNVAHSLYMGLLCNVSPGVLVVFGDLIFDYDALPDIDSSFLMVSSHNMRKEEIGVLINNGEVVNMSYDLNKKWCQMAYLEKDHLKHIFSYCRLSGHNRHYMFEALNSAISECGPIKAVECNGKIIEVDTIQHLIEANKVFK